VFIELKNLQVISKEVVNSILVSNSCAIHCIKHSPCLSEPKRGKKGKSQTSEKISLQIFEVFNHNQILDSLILVVFLLLPSQDRGALWGFGFACEDAQKNVFYFSYEKLTYKKNKMNILYREEKLSAESEVG